MFRWLGRNLSTLILAFVLALFVWVSAVISTDPNEERLYPRGVPLDIIGLDASFDQVLQIPSQVRITLNAPQSIWNELNTNPDRIRAWVDLSGLGKGEYTLEVKTQIDLSPVQLIKVDPQEIKIQLERRVSATFPVLLSVTGDPALGYRKGEATLDPAEVTIIGPESAVSQVNEVRAAVDISGADESITQPLAVKAVDQAGNGVTGIIVTPSTVKLDQPIILLGGYRNVVVKVVTTGQVADGYWLTNISTSPPNVTVFSADPLAVNNLPGYVETNPIDLSDLSDDIDIRATLNLPEDVSLAGDESVLVRLSIAAREGSLPINLPIEVVGLSPEFIAMVSPDTVDLLLTGPLPILNNLTPVGIRVAINLSGMEPGIYQVPPVVDLLPNQVRVASFLPENVEVIIQLAPTPTPTSDATTLGTIEAPQVTATPSPVP